MTSSAPRHSGRVKFFNSVKGFGFIIPDDQAGQENIEEVFVHHTAIQNEGGFKSLGEGEEVEYDLVQGPKGMQASNVSGPGGNPVKGDPNAGRRPFESRYDRYGGGQQSGRFGSYGNVFGEIGPYGIPQTQASFPYNMAPYGMYGQQYPANFANNSQSAGNAQQQQQQQRHGGPFSPVGSPIGYQGYPAQFAQFGQQPMPGSSGAGSGGYHTGYQDRSQQHHSSSNSSNSAGNTTQ
ncbi:cold-shock' DNA-binding domain-containing protein [Umbelopsis sp. AD052]|nr:cold-shock' DNA-binding domain-containing protein [Umbelopsis sp. AD052]